MKRLLTNTILAFTFFFASLASSAQFASISPEGPNSEKRSFIVELSVILYVKEFKASIQPVEGSKNRVKLWISNGEEKMHHHFYDSSWSTMAYLPA